jgi:hypothetical protein
VVPARPAGRVAKLYVACRVRPKAFYAGKRPEFPPDRPIAAELQEVGFHINIKDEI